MKIEVQVIRQHAGHQGSKRCDLLVGDRLRILTSTDNIDRSYGLEHRQLMIPRERYKAVSWEKRNFDFLLTIFPLARRLTVGNNGSMP